MVWGLVLQRMTGMQIALPLNMAIALQHRIPYKIIQSLGSMEINTIACWAVQVIIKREIALWN